MTLLRERRTITKRFEITTARPESMGRRSKKMYRIHLTQKNC